MPNKTEFINSLRQMSDEDLQNRITEDEFRLKKLKFAHSVSPIENPMNIRGIRRDLARAKTELKRRETAGVQTENN